MLQEWLITIDGDSENNVMSVRVDTDDIDGEKIYVVGYTKSTTIGVEPEYTAYPGRYGNFDGFVIKCSSTDGVITKDGANAWTRRFGGTEDDFVYSIGIKGDESIYFAGASSSNTINITEYQAGATNNLGGSDGFIAKYDTGGRLTWSLRLGGTNNDVITCIVYYDAYVFVGGYTSSSIITGETTETLNTSEDGFVAKYDTDGNQIWIKRLGGSGNDKIYGSVCDTDSNLYICGVTESDYLGNESASAQNNLGKKDGFVAKYNSSGDLQWLHRIGGTEDDEVKSIAIDDSNYIYIGGITSSPTIANESTTTSSGTNHVFIAKYSPDGVLQWTTRYKSSTGDTTLTSMACGFDSSIFICGTTNSLVLQGESGSNNLVGYTDSYVAKFTTSGTFFWTYRTGYSLTSTSINTITLLAENVIVLGGQIDYNINGSTELSNIYGFFSKYTDTTYGSPVVVEEVVSVEKIDYCLKPFNRRSRSGIMAMCSNVSYSNLVTSGNDPKKSKALQYSSYVNTRKPMKYIYVAPVEVTSTSGIITTFAGTGESGTSGDGGLATFAKLQNPYCCNVDNSGNIYIADDSNRIRKIDKTTGIITTVVGYGVQSIDSQNIGDGGIATSATMNLPLDVVIDSSNNMYICDNGNSRIRKVDATTGIINTISGTGDTTAANLSNLGDGGEATAATFNNPSGICLDNSQNIYIADTKNTRIRKINAITGIIDTIAGTYTLASNYGDDGLAINANVREPMATCLDSFGNIYIADTGNRRIRKIDATTGIITTICGTGNSSFNGDGIAASSANLGKPVDIITDINNNIYIADMTHQRVRKITYGTNIITTVAGTGSSGYSGDNGYAISATLNSPVGLSMDNLGNLYIADMANFVIRKVSA